MGPIGIFDSGYGGLTILKEIRRTLPEYNFLYLGDNARAPYGDRSFDVVHEFTLEAVKYLFKNQCPLVILACNTSSAKALRNIQQKYIAKYEPDKRVLGVIRPSTEEIGKITKTKKVGVLGTRGTIESNSYQIELNKFNPEITIYQHACPMWVPLIENGMHNTEEGIRIIKNDINNLLLKDNEIDTIVLACTHYPIVEKIISNHIGSSINIIAQGALVAKKLKEYLDKHKKLEHKLIKNNEVVYHTTETKSVFNAQASKLLKVPIYSKQVLI